MFIYLEWFLFVVLFILSVRRMPAWDIEEKVSVTLQAVIRSASGFVCGMLDRGDLQS